MANLNAGNPVRWENGGTVLIAALDIKNVVEGSLEWEIAGYEPAPNMDRATLTEVIAGNERPSKVKLSLKHVTAVGSGELLAQTMGAFVTNKIDNKTNAGLIFTFSMTIKVPAYKGATTGTQYVFAKCYLESPTKFKAAAGVAFDTIDLECINHEMSPTITMY